MHENSHGDIERVRLVKKKKLLMFFVLILLIFRVTNIDT